MSNTLAHVGGVSYTLSSQTTTRLWTWCFVSMNIKNDIFSTSSVKKNLVSSSKRPFCDQYSNRYVFVLLDMANLFPLFHPKLTLLLCRSSLHKHGSKILWLPQVNDIFLGWCDNNSMLVHEWALTQKHVYISNNI